MRVRRNITSVIVEFRQMVGRGGRERDVGPMGKLVSA